MQYRQRCEDITCSTQEGCGMRNIAYCTYKPEYFWCCNKNRKKSVRRTVLIGYKSTSLQKTYTTQLKLSFTYTVFSFYTMFNVTARAKCKQKILHSAISNISTRLHTYSHVLYKQFKQCINLSPFTQRTKLLTVFVHKTRLTVGPYLQIKTTAVPLTSEKQPQLAFRYTSQQLGQRECLARRLNKTCFAHKTVYTNT